MLSSKRNLVYLVLSGVFITNAVVAELIGGKIIMFGPFIMSIGIIPWPIVFLATDLINEYYGKSGVRRLSVITAALIAYAFIILFFAMRIPAAGEGISPVSDEDFHAVFGQSMWIIVGSIAAFLSSQMIDVFVFWFFRNKTGGKMLWLRSTGSTAISQLIDTFMVTGIAFLLPGKWTVEVWINASFTGYVCKLIIAVILTPVIYAGHSIIDKYLGKEADLIIEESAKESAAIP